MKNLVVSFCGGMLIAQYACFSQLFVAIPPISFENNIISHEKFLVFTKMFIQNLIIKHFFIASWL